VGFDRLRKLDALFAEKVLGCKVGKMVTLVATTSERDEPLVCCCYGIPRPHGRPLLPYTRSLDAAWEGAVKLQCGGHNLVMLRSDSEWRADQLCYATVSSDDDPATDWTYCPHPAEALVLACLRAVGVKDDELPT